ncbi:RNase RNM [Volucribacter amazonae]|uniref:Phosphatase n=1 Tax=Volucribacter amazonae TaxID=256731 RepID=A0A9X4SH83_9PAST|nr:PHP domain-containing protein [Volucribacter amazonae]MDG6894165.1 phosphatase [Volucribacter amazonae]
MIYDLHSHSTFSDGVLTPTELVIRAKQQGVDILALTDHDTVAGLTEAHSAAQHYGIRLINGVEISTLWQNKEIHIVGLGFDIQHSAIQRLLSIQAQLRQQRALMIADKLQLLGIEQAFIGASALANGEVTRAHYARYLVNIGKAKDIAQAFKRYLAQGKPAYVKPQWCEIAGAISAIHQAGGLAILAHPLRYNMTNRWIKRLITDFCQWQGDGLEVAGCGQSSQQRELLLRWAKEFDLLCSAGSDFHFPCAWIELGKSLALNCDDKFVLQHAIFQEKDKKV